MWLFLVWLYASFAFYSLNDVWVFDIELGTWSFPHIRGVKPAARFGQEQVYLVPFLPVFKLYTPWKHHKTRGFLGGIVLSKNLDFSKAFYFNILFTTTRSFYRGYGVCALIWFGVRIQSTNAYTVHWKSIGVPIIQFMKAGDR